MSEARIIYTARDDATPERERATFANLFRFVLEAAERDYHDHLSTRASDYDTTALSSNLALGQSATLDELRRRRHDEGGSA